MNHGKDYHSFQYRLDDGRLLKATLVQEWSRGTGNGNPDTWDAEWLEDITIDGKSASMLDLTDDEYSEIIKWTMLDAADAAEGRAQ